MILSKIPLPPSHNAAYRHNRVSKASQVVRRFKSQKFRNWDKEFNGWHYKNLNEVSKIKHSIHELVSNYKIKPGYIVIHTYFHFFHKSIFTLKGMPKRLDTSNRVKIIHDAISSVIGIDDSWFFNGCFYKRISEFKYEYCDVILEWVEVS